MIRSSICRKSPFAFSWLWFRFSYSTAALSPKTRQSLSEHLVNRHQFSIAAASKVSSRISNVDSFERYDSILIWLKDIGLSQIQLEKAISRVPAVLLTDLDKTMKPKHKIFKDLGFPSSDVADIIATDPWLLNNRSASRISTSIMALKGILGSIEDVSRLLKICTWFLKSDLDKKLFVNIRFLQKDCGVSPLQIKQFLFNFPRLLLNQPEFIRGIARKVDEIKFGNRNSRMFLHAVRAISSMTPERWEAKLKLLRSLGLSEEDVSCVFRRAPAALARSDRKIMEVIDLLVGSGRCDMSLLIRHPGIFLCSVEQRIKPRLLVLDLLEANNLLQNRPVLSCMCKMSHRDFLNKYVLPHSDVLGKISMPDRVQ